MDQIIKYIPSNVTTFIDVMGGAFNVGANIVADTVVYNEYNPYVFNLIKYIIETNKEKIIDYTETQIKDFNLKKKDKDTYVNFRNHYNKTKSIQDLFVLTMFCFQNQMRFNNKMEFNTPVGNCAYNENLKNRILNFIPKTSNIELLNKDFSEIDYKNYDKNSLFYFDPPYFITNATYNDGKRGFKGWDEELEKQLLVYIQNISKNGYRFMLSNVIEHKEKINEILKKWVEENGYNVAELTHSTRKEVLITNFDLQKGTR
jgi:adenine-specific DNA-methyltransferase